MSLLPVPEGELRWGYTTGACATACTRAALVSLLEQRVVEEEAIVLPGGQVARFRIHGCRFDATSASCATIKDAGDDPDVTHGAEITSTVILDSGEGEGFPPGERVRFLPGEGVGMVTLPGLSIPVGEPAINPVPRRMMREVVEEVLATHGMNARVSVSVSVRDGAVLAARTLNGRLGITGGISILGTTGLVKPYSASAYIASIEQGIDVALANGAVRVVINSGGRSEKLLQRLNPELPPWCFIQYGNWIGETLEKIRSSALGRFTIGMMLGKAVKLAAGQLNTHSSEGSWDADRVVSLAMEAGYPATTGQAIRELNRAGRLTEVFPFRQEEPFYPALARKCGEVIRRVTGAMPFDMVLIDARDELLFF